jgi:hypothetical protein
MKSKYSEEEYMNETAPWIREPSVKTIVRDNGNRTALEQWLLLMIVPALVGSGLYLTVRSQMTAEAWYTVFTVIGVVIGLGLLWRFGRWHDVQFDPAKTRRPDTARLGLNLIANSWPMILIIVWQSMIVTPLTATVADRWWIVILFIVCACAVMASMCFGLRMVRELRDPLAGNSIEIGVRERELAHEERMVKLAAKNNRASAEYAAQLEDRLAQTEAELAKARRGARVIFANHGAARGDSNLIIDDNELLNRFVLEAFSGAQRTRDEWSQFLIVDPTTETSTTGRQRYDAYRTMLSNAGLWNMKSGPIKTLEEACAALSVPLPQAKNSPAGGRAGVESALATPPDWIDRAGGDENESLTDIRIL